MDQTRSSVLVVSTDLEVLRALTRALTWTGYAVTVATDWSEVPVRLHVLPLSVMVYDLKDLDTKEWRRLEDLRADHPDLSVVLLSSLESPELDRALAEGLIAGYQVKPIHLTALEECLERIAARGATNKCMGPVATDKSASSEVDCTQGSLRSGEAEAPRASQAGRATS